MPHFYLHVRTADGEIRDEEGIDLADIEAARAEAIAGARSILSQEVLRGDLPLDERIDVEDEAGTLLLSISFLEAVHIRKGSRAERAKA